MQNFYRSGRNRNFTLGGHTKSSVCIRAKRDEGVNPQETEPDLPASVGGSPAEAGGGCGSPQGQGHWQQRLWEVLVGVNPARVTVSPTKGPVGSSAGSSQAKQPPGKELSPTHQETSRLKF